MVDSWSGYVPYIAIVAGRERPQNEMGWHEKRAGVSLSSTIQFFSFVSNKFNLPFSFFVVEDKTKTSFLDLLKPLLYGNAAFIIMKPTVCI